jgi:hypothetical protein
MSIAILLELKIDGGFVQPFLPSRYARARWLWGDPLEYSSEELMYPTRLHGREIALLEFNTAELLTANDYNIAVTVREDSRTPNIRRYTSMGHILALTHEPEGPWYYRFRCTNIMEVQDTPYVQDEE